MIKRARILAKNVNEKVFKRFKRRILAFFTAVNVCEFVEYFIRQIFFATYEFSYFKIKFKLEEYIIIFFS